MLVFYFFIFNDSACQTFNVNIYWTDLYTQFAGMV